MMNMRQVIHYKDLIGSVVANITAQFNTITTHIEHIHLSTAWFSPFHNFLVKDSIQGKERASTE